MYKVTFGEYNSYDDFGLYLTNLQVGEPAVKSNYINLPARDGQLDLSGVLSDTPLYDMRTISYTFVWRSNVDDFESEVSAIVNALHGQTMDVIHGSSPYFYRGKLSVSSPSITNDKAQIQISLNAEPYALKREKNETTITLSETERETTIINAGGKKVVPEFTLSESGTAIVKFGNVEVSMDAGTHRFANVIFAHGENTITVSGSGTLTVAFREGTL